MTEVEAKEIWQECDRELSMIVVDRSGKYAGFTVVTPKGYIDSVAVHPGCQGQGIARSLYLSLLKKAAQRGMARIHTVVSSNNEPSLQLHRKLGFHEAERRRVWELLLT